MATSGYELQGENNDDDERRPLMVHVKAPATLEAGYTFEALINDDPSRPFQCEVPEGGVKQGQVFLVPAPNSLAAPRLRAPTGKWKDGLFDCFSLGVLHPSLWCACCCSKVGMAQVMTRMQLTWLGEPGGAYAATQNTFRVVMILLVAYVIYSTSLEIAEYQYSANDAAPPSYLAILKSTGSILFSIWSIYSLCRTRQSIRERYNIPDDARCRGMEDCCCAFWCTCCTVSQMLRHTGEHETYPAVCCSITGHPPGTPLTV